MTTKPYLFQRRGVRKARRLGYRCLVASDPGTGKSFMALLSAIRAELRPIVVVCPACVKENWSREVTIHTGWPAQILESTRPDTRGLVKAPRVVIVNYDILGQRQGENTGPGWIDWLVQLKPQLIVIDECQALCNRGSRRTNWVRQLCQGVPHVIALSGTPLVNRPSELWPTLNIIRPDLFPSFWPYAKKFCGPRLAPWGWTYTGASNLPELHSIMQENVMIRFRKSDVLKDLPPKRRIVVPLYLSDPDQYTEAVDNYLAWVEKNYGLDRKRKAAKAEQITRLTALRMLAAQLKLKSVIEWTDNFLEESGGKVPLFGIHTSVIEQLKEHYKDRCVTVTGSTPGSKRQALFDQFNLDKKTRVLIGNIDAAGVGWNCTASSTPTLFELPWSPGRVVQCEDRCHGIKRGKAGQRVTTYLLVAKGTIEEKLSEVLQKKARTLSSVLDGRGDADPMDIYDLLTLSLQKNKGGAV